METGHGIKSRQLHIEDYLKEIPAEQGRVLGVYAHEWITVDTDTNTDDSTCKLLNRMVPNGTLRGVEGEGQISPYPIYTGESLSTTESIK